ncbi:MAG: CBS domain-containing protein, partial [Thermodesulfovibrio sp.]|nr:CBS domain-containing protein [Thermodesulfovibrio sp.]
MDYKKLLITKEKSLIEAMKQLSETAKKILFVVDEDDRLIGTLTDGDIRRYILKTGRLDVNVEDICNKNPMFAKIGFDRQKIINIAKEKDIKYVPVVDENRRILEILVIEDVQTKVKTIHFQKLDIPVVIMAGGFGKRLDPFTRVLPKPLIPIGDKTI